MNDNYDLAQQRYLLKATNKVLRYARRLGAGRIFVTNHISCPIIITHHTYPACTCIF